MSDHKSDCFKEMHPPHISHNEMVMVEKNHRILDSHKVVDPVEMLRHLCLEKGFSGFLGFGRCFREMDHNGEKILNLRQFTKAMKQTGFELSNEEIEEIFNRFDMDGSGGVNISELLAHIRPEMSQSRKKIVHAAFDKMDKDQDGLITMEELKRCYNVRSNPRFQSGVQSEEAILKMFTDHFEENHHLNGEITREDFENYYAAVSGSIEDDTYFDLVIRQVYRL